ncbi:hypothetical protein B0H13DRAFT_1936654 [Mycena leptocephala]|nr:hypothetical protein B0H13DRAFT_1936654 [Mycena leptocephala]
MEATLAIKDPIISADAQKLELLTTICNLSSSSMAKSQILYNLRTLGFAFSIYLAEHKDWTIDSVTAAMKLQSCCTQFTVTANEVEGTMAGLGPALSLAAFSPLLAFVHSPFLSEGRCVIMRSPDRS